GGDRHAVPRARQGPFQGPAHGFFVIDDQDVAHRFAHSTTGSSMRKTVRSDSRRQQMVPPWASATWRATASPRPTPSRLLVTKGSKRRSTTSGGGPGPESAISTRQKAEGSRQ